MFIKARSLLNNSPHFIYGKTSTYTKWPHLMIQLSGPADTAPSIVIAPKFDIHLNGMDLLDRLYIYLDNENFMGHCSSDEDEDNIHTFGYGSVQNGHHPAETRLALLTSI